MYLTGTPITLGRFFESSCAASCGALNFFVGIVRDEDHGKRVKKLSYECYPSMAEKMISTLIAEARSFWPVDEVRVSHRIGDLAIGDVAVVAAVSSKHREDAFSACRFMIEGIKTKVPIWKKQFFADGTDEWVFCAHLEEHAPR